MSIRGITRLAGFTLAITLLPVAGCSGGGSGTAPPSQAGDETRAPCGLSDKLVPSCGALWGITTAQPTLSSLDAAERSVSRRFDLVYRFHDINDSVPTNDERRLSSEGRILHLSIDAKDHSSGHQLSWDDVASGRYDDDLRRQALGISTLGKPVFITFDHEADQADKEQSGSGKAYVAAWRHVHDLFISAGATNTVWVWVMMGTQSSLMRAAQLWPGNAYVDWISWDVYNASGCRTGRVDPSKYVSFETSMRMFYDWVHRSGPSLGIDTTKPMMISEAGSVVYSDVSKTLGWYQQIPATLRRYTQIKAVALWDHAGKNACNYQFSGNVEMQPGMTAVSAEAWVNPLETR